MIVLRRLEKSLRLVFLLLFNHDMDWFETKRSKLLFMLFNNLCVLFWKYFLKNKSIHVEVLLLIGGVYKLLVIVQKGFSKSCSIFNIGSNFLQFCKNFSKETGIWVNAKHGGAQAVDNIHTTIPESVFIGFHQKRFQWVTDFITHITEKEEKKTTS